MPPLRSHKRRRLACQHFPDGQTLRLQAGAGEDDVIHLPSGLDRVDCERQEEEEEPTTPAFQVDTLINHLANEVVCTNDESINQGLVCAHMHSIDCNACVYYHDCCKHCGLGVRLENGRSRVRIPLAPGFFGVESYQ